GKMGEKGGGFLANGMRGFVKKGAGDGLGGVDSRSSLQGPARHKGGCEESARLSAEVKQAAEQGKCPATAMKEVKLDKCQTWLSYGQYLAGNVERYCFWWSRGHVPSCSP